MKMLSHRQLADLVKRAGKGDQEAFAILYAATVEHQLYFATVFLRDASLAEDVVQEVYLSLFLSLGKINNPKLFVAYLNRICYNACVAQAQKKSRDLAEPDSDSLMLTADRSIENDPESRYAVLEQNSKLLAALSALNSNHKTAFLMRYYHNMKVRDIAIAMDCSESTVKRYFNAAAKQLKALLHKKSEPDRKDTLFVMMLFRFSPLYGPLHDSASLVAPDTETYQNILIAVMKAAQDTGAVGAARAGTIAGTISYAEALSGMSKLTHTAKIGLAVQTAAVGTGIAVATAGMTLAPEVTDVRFSHGEGFTRQAEVLVCTRDTLPYAKVWLIPDNGGSPIEAAEGGGGQYYALVDENGVYTVEATNPNGETAHLSFEVDCIDSTIPTMDGFSADADYLYIHFSDSQSGLEWESIHAVGLKGEAIAPVEIQRENGIVVFERPDSDITIFVTDMAGNEAKSVCTVN